MEKVGPHEAETKFRVAFKLPQADKTGVLDGIIEENTLVEIDISNWLNFIKEVLKYHIKSWLEKVKKSQTDKYLILFEKYAISKHDNLMLFEKTLAIMS